MPSIANPHLFRFEDNTGAILTSFSRVIRRSTGVMNQYSQAVERANINLGGIIKYRRSATQSLRQIVNELDSRTNSVRARTSSVVNRPHKELIRPTTAALPLTLLPLLQRLATLMSSFARIIGRAISAIKNSLAKRAILRSLKDILLAIGGKFVSLIRQGENEIRVHEIVRLANERSRQVSETEDALIFRNRTLDDSKEELRRLDLLADALELLRINSARLTDNYIRLGLEIGKLDEKTADLIVTFLKTNAELPHYQDRLAAAIQNQKKFIEEVTEFYKESEQALQNFENQTRRLKRVLQNIENQLENQQKILQMTTYTLATVNRDLATHSASIATSAHAYRDLSKQIGATVGDVLSGEVSFKEAWESLGRGVLETVRNLGRQVVDSLLGDVRDLGRRLSDVIFGQLQGMLGSFGFGGSRGFLPSFLAGGSLGGLPVGFPTFPTGGGFSFGGFPVGGGSQLWNAGAATVARYLPFTAPTLASYGFAVSPVGLGVGSGGVAPGLNAGALGVTPRYAAPVPGVNAPPAAGFGPFSPAALGALGGLGGSSGGTALLGALGYRPGITSTIGGFAGGIAGSLATPALTALLAPALGPLAPLVGPLFGTFFGTTLGGLFGMQPTRIDTEKRGLRQFFRNEVPGYDYSKKERRVGRGLSAARASGLSVEEAYIAAGIPYALAVKKGGLGTLTRFRNIGVGGLGRSGASLEQARAAALRVARATGTDTTAGAVEALNRALGGGFARDKFTVAEVLENVGENAGETRSTRNRPVRLRDAVQGIFDIQTQFAGFVDSGKLAAQVIADETAQALTAAGRDANRYADVLDRIRSGATHAAEGLREIGGLDFAGEGSFTEALASLGRGVRERSGSVGRGPLNSLLLFVRDLRRGLSDAIFGQLGDAIGFFRRSAGDGFLTFLSLTVPILSNNATPSRI